MAQIPPALTVRGESMVPAGKVVLMRRGKIIWFGNLADPWDDADFDVLIVSPADYERIAPQEESASGG